MPLHTFASIKFGLLPPPQLTISKFPALITQTMTATWHYNNFNLSHLILPAHYPC